MMTTTIMISTSVKPLVERVFILSGLCGYIISAREVRAARIRAVRTDPLKG
jgi:hypothetical protein